MKMMLAVAAVAAILTGCSPQDKANAHLETDKAKVEIKGAARQTAQDLKKAGNAIDRGAERLKNKVDKELNTPDTSGTADRTRDTRQR